MTILTSGEQIILRDQLPSDVDVFIRWQTSGEWRLYDAPWEGVRSSLTEEQVAKMRSTFLKNCTKEQLHPRSRALIARHDGRPIGWVNRYSGRSSTTWLVGIDICEDDCLERGLGTEALRLWVDYLFANSDVHRIGLDTWSLNPRMIRVAEKLGFRLEGVQREVRQWEGEWLDLIHFGILRGEWE